MITCTSGKAMVHTGSCTGETQMNDDELGSSTRYKLACNYSKTCVKQPLSKRQKIGFQDQLSLNAGQKYCRMLQGEHSAILLTCIKLPFVIKIYF